MKRKPHKCPCCGDLTDKIHDYREQPIKDIPVFGKKLIIHLRKHWYRCQCGKRFFEANKFLPRYHRMTNRLSAHITNELANEVSFTSVGQKVNLSTTTVMRVFDLVSYAPKKLPARLNELLMELYAKLDRKTIGLLKECLWSEIEQSKSNPNNAIKVYPEPEKFSKLNSVEYWCYTNSLKSNDFKGFLGYSDVFDFYILYNKFDFSKFDPSWILIVNKKSLDRLASDEVVKEKIRQRIVDVLKKDEITVKMITNNKIIV